MIDSHAHLISANVDRYPPSPLSGTLEEGALDNPVTAERLIELLDRFLDLPPGELEVHVGLEQAHPAMKDLTLIGMTVRMASGMPAKVAVLGPMRMQYERVMAAVLQTSRALGSAPF